MPTTLGFSTFGLICAVTMAGYHGFYLVSRFVLPEPHERAVRGARAVWFELLLTASVLGPLLRRVLPANSWVGGKAAASAAIFYVLIFAWLPIAKVIVLVGSKPGPEKDRGMALLYSVPMSLLYVAGIGYLLFVTIMMMITS